MREVVGEENGVAAVHAPGVAVDEEVADHADPAVAAVGGRVGGRGFAGGGGVVGGIFDVQGAGGGGFIVGGVAAEGG